MTHTRVLYPVPEALQLLSLGRTKFYREVKAGRITLVRSGAKSLVPASAIDEYEQKLIAEAEAQRKATA